MSQPPWTTEQSRQRVTTAIVVHGGGAKHPEIKVSAFVGWGKEEAVSVPRAAWRPRRNQRERFGIESTYRHTNQACCTGDWPL